MKKICLFLLILVFIPAVISVGVSPPSQKYIFEPGMEGEANFYFRNNLEAPATLIASLGGELEEYAEITSDEQIYLEPQERGFVEISFDLPENIGEPGWHSFNVLATEAKGTGGTVGARGQIVVPVKFFVQYPGEKLELKLDAKDAGEGESVTFNLHISNVGTQKVSDAQAKIDIYKEQDKVGEVKSEKFAVDVLKSTKLEVSWDAENASSGVYSAKGIIDYNSGNATANDTFKIGNFDIKVLNFTRKVGEKVINRFLLKLENEWNREINNLFADISVIKNESVATKFSIAKEIIEPWEIKTLSGFLDAENLEKGVYDLRIKLKFSSGDDTMRKTVNGKLEVVGKEEAEEIKREYIEQSGETEGPAAGKIKGIGDYLTTTNLLVGLVLALIIVNIIILLKRRKNGKKEGNSGI